MNLQQVKKDLENGVLISPVTWLRVLETALELKGAQGQLVAVQKAAEDYLLALDQWENTNKAERRVKTAEAVLRAASAAATTKS